MQRCAIFSVGMVCVSAICMGACSALLRELCCSHSTRSRCIATFLAQRTSAESAIELIASIVTSQSEDEDSQLQKLHKQTMENISEDSVGD